MERIPIEEPINRLLDLYESVVTARHRPVQLLGRKCIPQVLRTFLGYELQLGRKRISCPDLATARYLKVFGELGMKEVKIPYNPIQTRDLLPDLEECFEEIVHALRSAQHRSNGPDQLVREVYRRIRGRLESVEQQLISEN